MLLQLSTLFVNVSSQLSMKNTTQKHVPRLCSKLDLVLNQHWRSAHKRFRIYFAPQIQADYNVNTTTGTICHRSLLPFIEKHLTSKDNQNVTLFRNTDENQTTSSFGLALIIL